MAIVAGVSEAGAGALLVLGLLTPLASAAVIGHARGRRIRPPDQR